MYKLIVIFLTICLNFKGVEASYSESKFNFSNRVYGKVLTGPKFQAVVIDGQLKGSNHTPRILRKLKSSLKAQETPLYLIVRDAKGGGNESHEDVMNVLHRRSSRVVMVVMGPCRSACTMWAAMASETWLVSGRGEMQVHRSSDGGGYDDPSKILSIEEMVKIYNEFGANGNWIRNNQWAFSPDGVLEPLNSRQSFEFGIVDRVVSAGDLKEVLGVPLFDWINRN